MLYFFSFFSLLSSAPAQETGPWSVTSIAGVAEVRTANHDWQSLSKDLQVGVGHEIRTGKDGRVVLARGDESVTISPDSSFEAKPARTGMMTQIFQKAGTLMFKVHKRPNRHFEVQTPYLVAAVKGTTFTVSVDPAGGAVHVVEGLVEVGNLEGTNRVLVRPGVTVSVAAGPNSKVQIGVTPKKSSQIKGKQSKATVIKREIGNASFDLEKSSKGLFRNPHVPGATQVANANAKNAPVGSDANNAGGIGNAFGKDNSFAGNLGTGLALGLGNGNGNAGGGSGGNSAAGSANSALGGINAGLGIGNGASNGVGNGLGNGIGQGKGKGKN